MRMNHIALSVSNRTISADFYREWFGMNKPIHEDDHLLILANENGDLLALSEGEPDTPWKRTTHFGFQIESPEEVRAMRTRFAEAGIKEAEWQESGPTRCQVYDPDGYRVEVYAFDW